MPSCVAAPRRALARLPGGQFRGPERVRDRQAGQAPSPAFPMCLRGRLPGRPLLARRQERGAVPPGLGLVPTARAASRGSPELRFPGTARREGCRRRTGPRGQRGLEPLPQAGSPGRFPRGGPSVPHPQARSLTLAPSGPFIPSAPFPQVRPPAIARPPALGAPETGKQGARLPDRRYDGPTGLSPA